LGIVAAEVVGGTLPSLSEDVGDDTFFGMLEILAAGAEMVPFKVFDMLAPPPTNVVPLVIVPDHLFAGLLSPSSPLGPFIMPVSIVSLPPPPLLESGTALAFPPPGEAAEAATFGATNDCGR
jgi:hypothetical protein